MSADGEHAPTTLHPAQRPDDLDFTPEQLSYVEEMRAQNRQLADTMRRLVGLQEQLVNLRKSASTDQALDNMETLLEGVIDFTFLRLYLHPAGEEAELQLAREMCPQDYDVDWELIRWALAKQEISFIPFDAAAGGADTVQSLLILPLVGHSEQMGVLLLWVESDMTAFTQERSTLLGMLARETGSVLETIRLRQRVEAARAELADVVENVPLGLLAIDSRERITLINGTAEFIFNVRRDAAMGKNLGELLPRRAVSQIRAMINGQGPDAQLEGEVELELGGDVGETFGISVAPMRAAEEEGEEESQPAPQGYVIVCRDLKLSREVAKLRELDSMKNDFLSLVSHELRTPLTSIMAYSETLLMEGMIDTEEERKEYLEIIHSEGERLSRLINDVLDLTKMESGKMDYSYTELELEDVVHGAIAAVHSLAQQKEIDLPVEMDEAAPAVTADRDKIIQVLTNLYSNAIKFSEEKTEVRTTVTYLPEADLGETRAPAVQVAVRDQGMGIAPEDIHKVFSKFEQIEKIDHHSVGTGLGMPICKQIIEEGHAGRIWIESEQGEGTTVTFLLPVT